MSDSINLYQSLSVSPYSVSAFIFLIKFSYSSLPYHNISSVSSFALDIHPFLKLFTTTSGEMHCHALVIQID